MLCLGVITFLDNFINDLYVFILIMYYTFDYLQVYAHTQKHASLH